MIDQGIGIADTYINDVFKPFHQVDNSYNRETGGTGLGLALVKALTELHGGAVTLDSKLGRGTCVRVVFPPSDLPGQPALAI